MTIVAGSMAAPGRATSRSRSAKVASSRARWATVDQRAGCQPDVVRGRYEPDDVTPTPRTWLAVSRISSTVSRPADEASDVFDHVRFGEPRRVGAQPGVLIDEHPDDLLESQRPSRRVAPTHATVQPGRSARPTIAASDCQRPTSRLGVRSGPWPGGSPTTPDRRLASATPATRRRRRGLRARLRSPRCASRTSATAPG